MIRPPALNKNRRVILFGFNKTNREIDKSAEHYCCDSAFRSLCYTNIDVDVKQSHIRIHLIKALEDTKLSD